MARWRRRGVDAGLRAAGRRDVPRPAPPPPCTSTARSPSRYEAAERPGHFDGVATIVTKLLDDRRRPTVPTSAARTPSSSPSCAGSCADLDLPVEVVAVDTVREPDGLAMSSRNAYLTPAAARQGARASTGRCWPARAAAAKARARSSPRSRRRLVVGFPPYLAAGRRPRRPAAAAVLGRLRRRGRPRQLRAARRARTRRRASPTASSSPPPAWAPPADRQRRSRRRRRAVPQTTTPHEPDPHDGPASDRKE